MKTLLREQLRPALLSGENLVWVDRPENGVKFKPIDLFLIPFSIVWAGGFFMAFGVNLMGNSPGRAPFPIFFLLPFLIIAFYITIGRFMHEYMIRKRTVYGITDRGRILIKTGLFKKSLSNYEIKYLPRVEFSEKKDRTGSIKFGQNNSSPYSRHNQWIMSFKGKFLQIQNVKEVYQMIMSYR
ncbi:MAG: hypothetical protein AAFN10_08040 [Bacteroidota bacterium]